MTGAGAPGTRGTLFALRQNSDNQRVNVIGVDIKEDVVGKYWVERFYKVPVPESEEYVPQMNEICSKESVDVVLPQTTRETAVLSHRHPEIKSKVIVSESFAIGRANNKFELLKVCRNLGIPVPKFSLIQSIDGLEKAAADLDYPAKPVVVKPPVSFGSRGLRVIREGTLWNTHRFLEEKPDSTEITLGDLKKILTADKESGFPELLMSEFLPGVEYTVDAFKGNDGSVAIPRLRKQIVNGITFRSTLEYRKDITEYSLKAASELGLRYAFGFQFKMDSAGLPRMLECNPRVQGTMVASYFSGANVIWMAVREALGLPFQEPSRPLKPGEFYRYWGGLALSDSGTSEV